MTEVFAFLLNNFGKVFDYLRSFQLFPGLNLLQFLVICLVIDVCFMLFFAHMPSSDSVSAATSVSRSYLFKEREKSREAYRSSRRRGK